jgi:hypothetical protein
VDWTLSTITMKITAAVVATFGLLATETMAAIAIGKISPLGIDGDDQYTWIDGQPCNRNTARPLGEGNFCGKEVTLSNTFTYRFQGCGGPIWSEIKNSDGSWSFNSNCQGVSSRFNCGTIFNQDPGMMHHQYTCG